MISVAGTSNIKLSDLRFNLRSDMYENVHIIVINNAMSIHFDIKTLINPILDVIWNT